MYGNSGIAYQSLALGFVGDGVFGNQTSIETSSIWGVRGAFNHNWSPTWSSSLFGSYTSVNWGEAASALICRPFATNGATVGTTTASMSYQGGVCNPDFNIAQIGTVTRWTPVKGLTFSGEVMYTYLDQKSSGVITNLTASGAKPPFQTYELKDQSTWSGLLRAQRTF